MLARWSSSFFGSTVRRARSSASLPLDDWRYVDDSTIAPNQPLHAPAVVHELAGQMIEQFRMRRQFAHDAEVVDRAHDAATEQVIPHAIDHHAGRQRVRRDRATARPAPSRPLGGFDTVGARPGRRSLPRTAAARDRRAFYVARERGHTHRRRSLPTRHGAVCEVRFNCASSFGLLLEERLDASSARPRPTACSTAPDAATIQSATTTRVGGARAAGRRSSRADAAGRAAEGVGRRSARRRASRSLRRRRRRDRTYQAANGLGASGRSIDAAHGELGRLRLLQLVGFERRELEMDPLAAIGREIVLDPAPAVGARRELR